MIFLCSCGSYQKQEQSENVFVSDLHSTFWKGFKGLATFKDAGNFIEVKVNFRGLPPGKLLGFHIHENGECIGPDYKSAGAHWNPLEDKHGSPYSKTRHEGDMGNVSVNEKGEAQQIIKLPKSTFDDFHKLPGKSVILHAGMDDLKTDPSGNSGDRMACGLIKP